MDKISFECAKSIKELSKTFGIYCHKVTNSVWVYPVNSNGGHSSNPFIEIRSELYLDDIEEIWPAFDWNELRELMNIVVDGDYRKSEFEAIENIDEFAYELNEYLKIKKK